MKKLKSTAAAHAPKSPKGMGDFYGTGMKNPIGKMGDTYMNSPMKSKKKGKPPKSMA